jgi:predicted phosphodiesterase
MDRSPLRFIGDIHGEKTIYKMFAEGADYSIQLGDFDLGGYKWVSGLKLDPKRHVFIGGNHDNYDVIDEAPNCLGDFGVFNVPEIGDIFFVRGAWSIDHKGRRKFPIKMGGKLRPKDLWDEEELTDAQLNEAIRLYEQVKPRVLISHECPLKITPYVTDPVFAHNMGYDQPIIKTRTNQALQTMTEIHRPRIHLFGHYHRPFSRWIDGTTGEPRPGDEQAMQELGLKKEDYTLYVCVALLRYVDLTKDFLDSIS